jgi:D-glycero-alpha-D-manno-heptose-7-phosphate kinase
MILSKTPMRVSFVGGSTDLPAFYENNEYGCVISTAINRFVYVAIHPRFDDKIRLAYSENEFVSSIEEIKNERIREALKRLLVHDNIEIFYMSDIPKGTGLGGSSSFTVGLLHALNRFKGIPIFPERLAREACEIEIDVLKNPIGKQDQYAAALGGMNYLRFWANGTVSSEPILIDESLILSIMNNLVFIYLGFERSASDILTDVAAQMQYTSQHLLKMRDITDQLHRELMKRNIDQFPLALHENWELKKQTSSRISNGHINDLYNLCISAGATAGKLLGAGAGGFLMMYVPMDNQPHFFKKIKHLPTFKFDVVHSGSEIVHDTKGY